MSSTIVRTTREALFLLAPLNSVYSSNVKPVTTIKDLQTAKLNDDLTRFNIGKYKEAIITDALFSFFRYTDKQAYLIIIDKRSTDSDRELRRYNYYGLLQTYGKGQLVASTSEQTKHNINLTNIILKSSEAFILELHQFHEDYNDSQDWWMRDVIYEVLLSSYQDSNNDGIGDINGLRQRLDYIQSLGIRTIWLTPIYPSPWKDYGYDIKDFCSIDSRFGTLNDFIELIKDIHSRQMRIIIDFVPNHTSNEHPWFQAALRNDSHYVDYYIWHQGRNNGKDLPTNWLGASGQRMWTYSNERQMYYLHQFLDCQPDLNFRNENVRNEMKKILRFWLDLGVDGFRADAVRHLIENDRFHDESLSKHAKDLDCDVMYDAYEHTETTDQTGSYELVREWRKFLDDYAYDNHRDYILLITEAYNRDIEKVMKYYGLNREQVGSDVSINFLMTYYLDKNIDEKHALELDKQLDDWHSNLPDFAWSNWCLGSHDSRRVTSRLRSKDLIDAFYMLLLLQSGTGVIYYGDEIGMCDRPFTLEHREEILDITAFNYGDQYVEEKTRDCQRTPMQWTSQSAHAGFTSSTSQPYLPLSDTWKDLNVAQQEYSSRSHLKFFRQLIHLRRQAPFYGGYQKKLLVTKEIYSLVRWLEENVFLLVININSTDIITINFNDIFHCHDKILVGEIIARSCNILDNTSIGHEGNQIDLSNLQLRSNEAVLFKLFLSPDDLSLSCN